MKAIIKLRFTLVLLMVVGMYSQVYAQSHNVKALGCKYYQKSGKGAAVNTYEVCTVCKDKKEKEQKAKQAEDKRRHDVLVAKTKADNERKAKEAAEKQRLQNEKNKPVNATIVMSPSTGKSTPVKTEEKKDVKMEKNYFYSTKGDEYFRYDESILNNYFRMVSHHRISQDIFKQYSDGFTINGKKYFEGKYRVCIGKNTKKEDEFPANIGIVGFDDNRVEGHLNMDIIDINGKRLFNDNQINRITHIYGSLFLIERGIHRPLVDENDELGPAYIYNIETKKKQNVINFSYVNNGRPVKEAKVTGVYFGAPDDQQDWSRECVRYFKCLPQYSGKGPEHAYCFTKDGEVELYLLERISDKIVFKHIRTLDFK